MRRQFSAVLFASILSIAFSVSAIADNADSVAPAASVAEGYALVIFSQAPLAEWPNAARLKNGKLDFAAGANGQYQASLAQARNDFKQWLRSTGSPARVIREYDTVLNGLAVELNGASLDSLKAGPNVITVEPSLLFHPTMNRSAAIINAPAAWSALGGVANAGAGMKVGVIDTGIDQLHPFLTDPSLAAPTGFPKGDRHFTSNKVIVAKVYYTGRPGTYTAEALQDHGTHVSGTIAGVSGTTAPASGAIPAVNGLSGVAPKAFLGNYNVFPCTSPTNCITNATSHDIAQAIDDAVKDEMDVINMSLGGGINGFQDQLTVASNRAVKAGVVVAIAAGNSGPGVNTVESPGQAALAITAAASTNNHYLGVDVLVGSSNFGAAAGSFNSFTPGVSAQLANWNNTASGAAARTSSTFGTRRASTRKSVTTLLQSVRTFATVVSASTVALRPVRPVTVASICPSRVARSALATEGVASSSFFTVPSVARRLATAVSQVFLAASTGPDWAPAIPGRPRSDPAATTSATAAVRNRLTG